MLNMIFKVKNNHPKNIDENSESYDAKNGEQIQVKEYDTEKGLYTVVNLNLSNWWFTVNKEELNYITTIQ
jgi:hypothetical protein